MAEARTQFRFASPIMISQTIATGNQRIVEILIGIFLSPASVAFFRFGGNFTRILNQALITPIIQVLLPSFARSRSTPEANLSKALVMNSSVLFFVFLGVASIVPAFVDEIFGPQWREGGWIAMILCYNVFTMLIGPIAFPLLVVNEKGHWTAIHTTISLFVSIIFVAIGAQFGAIGAALGFVLRGLITIPLAIWVINKVLGIPPRKVVASFAPFAILAIFMNVALTFGLAPLTRGLPTVLDLSLQVVAGFLIYGAGLRVGIRKLAPEQYQLLTTILPGRVRRYF
jgi:PST family polysaccharide transporter